MKLSTLYLVAAIFMFSMPAAAQLSCEPGYYISHERCDRAPAGTISPGGTTTQYTDCSWTKYANPEQTECISCPPEYPYTAYRATSIEQCFAICMGGTYKASASDTKCTPVDNDSFAKLYVYTYGRDNVTDNVVKKCPAGRHTLGRIGYGADDETDCARILHVGDNEMRIVEKKKTSPGLAVSVDGVTYWAQMSQTPRLMSQTASQSLNIMYDDTLYWAFDDTVATRDEYPWESPDFDWAEYRPEYEYDNVAKTWRVEIANTVWSGITQCTAEDKCLCKMLKPAQSDWVWRGTYDNCDQQCPLECAWGYAYAPRHRYELIRAVIE